MALWELQVKLWLLWGHCPGSQMVVRHSVGPELERRGIDEKSEFWRGVNEDRKEGEIDLFAISGC